MSSLATYINQQNRAQQQMGAAQLQPNTAGRPGTGFASIGQSAQQAPNSAVQQQAAAAPGQQALGQATNDAFAKLNTATQAKQAPTAPSGSVSAASLGVGGNTYKAPVVGNNALNLGSSILGSSGFGGGHTITLINNGINSKGD